MRILTLVFAISILQLCECGNEGKELACTANNGPSSENNGDGYCQYRGVIGALGRTILSPRETSRELIMDLSIRDPCVTLEDIDEKSGVIHRSIALKDECISKRVIYGQETIWTSKKSCICKHAEVYIKGQAAAAVLELTSGSNVTFKAFQRMIDGWLDIGMVYINWILHEMMNDIEADVSLWEDGEIPSLEPNRNLRGIKRRAIEVEHPTVGRMEWRGDSKELVAPRRQSRHSSVSSLWMPQGFVHNTSLRHSQYCLGEYDGIKPRKNVINSESTFRWTSCVL